jgi:hypothetical protein
VISRKNHQQFPHLVTPKMLMKAPEMGDLTMKNMLIEPGEIEISPSKIRSFNHEKDMSPSNIVI